MPHTQPHAHTFTPTSFATQGVSLERLGIDREIAGALGLFWDPESLITVQLLLTNLHIVTASEHVK